MKSATIVQLLLVACAACMAAPASAEGRFKVQYSPAKSAANKKMEKLVRESRSFEQLTDAFNELFTLPKDITVHFKEDKSGDAPFYLNSEIVMSYEFLAENHAMFSKYDEDFDDKKVEARKQPPSEKEINDTVLQVGEFVFYHEMGHALVDAYELPVLGKEEDAVDTLAAIVSADYLEEPESALAGAESFGIYAAEKKEFEEADFYDEHSLDEQRFYSIVCMVYGSDPKKYAHLPKDAGMPADRAEQCQDDHDRQFKAWQTLLAPHMKKETAAK